jgi:hypothetical protein
VNGTRTLRCLSSLRGEPRSQIKMLSDHQTTMSVFLVSCSSWNGLTADFFCELFMAQMRERAAVSDPRLNEFLMAWGKEGRKKNSYAKLTRRRESSPPLPAADSHPVAQQASHCSPAPTTPAPLKTGQGAAATSRASPHSMATLPLDHVRPKRATPLSPPLFRYAPQLRSQRRNTAARVGSRLHADEANRGARHSQFAPRELRQARSGHSTFSEEFFGAGFHALSIAWDQNAQKKSTVNPRRR